MTEYQRKLFESLKKVRVNAVNLVDSFGWSDTNLGEILLKLKNRIFLLIIKTKIINSK